MNENQKKLVINYLSQLKEMDIYVHHGDCVGADYDFHKICSDKLIEKNIKIIIHPPINNKLRAYCNGNNVYINDPKDYLDRNRDIVDSCKILIGCPMNKNYEDKRSGTWYTINYAKKCNKELICY